MLGFAGALAVGTLFLWLPVSAAPGERTSFVDALFTATSALCVTGLTALDTATHWSGFGLVVILPLIQLGGLGIMVFAMLVGLALARKLSVRARMTAAAETKSDGAPEVRRIVRGIFLTSIAIEGVVALLLFGRILIAYRDEYGVGRAAWFAVFHAGRDSTRSTSGRCTTRRGSSPTSSCSSAARRGATGGWEHADYATVLGPDDTVLAVGPTRKVEAFAQLP